MKFAEELFPLGVFPDQRTAGGYIDGTLSANLDIFAKKIVNDMHFMGIITGNDSVGNGKSTFTTQIGTYLTWKINQLHKLDNTFTSKNMFFNSKELVKHSPNLPRYSVVVLDEGDDLTTHGMKELAVRLKRYFRKCRQLNQIVLLILPSFFELPKFYALARSHFLINVKFEGEFERGHFKFYGPTSKKLLYMKGRKEWDYEAHSADFPGAFSQSYMFFPNLDDEIKLYKKYKYQDMLDDSKEEQESKSIASIIKETKISLFRTIKRSTDITVKELIKGFAISDRTATTWLSDEYAHLDGLLNARKPKTAGNSNNPIEKVDDDREGEEEDGFSY